MTLLVADESGLTLPVILIPHPHVRVEAHVLGGSPYVVGSRVPVRRLWAFYARGASAETLLKRYPKLGPAKVFDALAFALDNPEVIEADARRERELLERAGQTPPTSAAELQQIELPFGGSDAGPSASVRRRAGRRRR
jgi:uncharacterized protein (DUF433 family)